MSRPRSEFRLSEGLLSKVFSFLNGKEVARLSLVCKPWANVSKKDQDLWKDLAAKDYSVKRKIHYISWRGAYICEWWRLLGTTEWIQRVCTTPTNALLMQCSLEALKF